MNIFPTWWETPRFVVIAATRRFEVGLATSASIVATAWDVRKESLCKNCKLLRCSFFVEGQSPCLSRLLFLIYYITYNYEFCGEVPEPGCPPSAEKPVDFMSCIYILFNVSSNKFYIGSTRESDTKVRLQAHNAGKTRSTKSGRPRALIHQEQFLNYTDAKKKRIIWNQVKVVSGLRRSGRGAECGGLENRWGRKALVGSNPTSSVLNNK